MTFSQAFDHFMLDQELSGNSPSTIRSYDVVLRLFRDWLVTNRPSLCDDITHMSLQDIISYHLYLKGRDHILTGRVISQKTIQSYLRHLKAFVSFLFREEILLGMDFSKKIRIPKVERPVIKVLTDDEIVCLFSCFDKSSEFSLRDYAICSLMLDCGLRVGDVCNLKASDVDYKLGYITIQNGKGGKGRVVPVGLRTRRVLLQYLRKRRLPMDIESDFLFLSTNRVPLTVHAVERIFKRLKLKSGIPRLHAHLLRHTFATNFLLSGLGDVHELGQILGHSDLKTTQVYLHTAGAYAVGRKKSKSYLDRL